MEYSYSFYVIRCLYAQYLSSNNHEIHNTIQSYCRDGITRLPLWYYLPWSYNIILLWSYDIITPLHGPMILSPHGKMISSPHCPWYQPLMILQYYPCMVLWYYPHGPIILTCSIAKQPLSGYQSSIPSYLVWCPQYCLPGTPQIQQSGIVTSLGQ